MKKYKKHNFNVYNYITDSDICSLCNKTGKELFIDYAKNASEEEKNEFENIFSIHEFYVRNKRTLEFQINWLKNNTKCITEEEFIIKQLLE